MQVALAFGKQGKQFLRPQVFLATLAAVEDETAVLNPAERLVSGLGGRAAVAERFGVSSEAVRLWLKNGIPADRALDAEEATSGTEFAITATEVLEYGRARKDAAQEAARAAITEERAA